ncbi:MAG: ABC transporter ATP-binding protein [Candidatus Dormiibacterota bacterium]
MTVQAATPAATSTFEVKGLTAGYGKQPIIFDVSARFVTGTLSAIIGPNGAGKSTLLKALFGIARVFQGSVLLDGDPVSLVSTSLVRQGIVYVPQLANVFPSLTVRENLEVGTFVRSGGALSRVLDLFPDLAPVMAKHAGKLSGGQRNMLAVARALMSDPRVLLLDESTGGLSPVLSQRLWEHLVQLRQDGLAVVVVEQNVQLALRHSDRVFVLGSGRNRLEGTPAELMARPDFEEFFLEGATASESIHPGLSLEESRA